MFNENEDMILPDDFQADQPQSEEINNDDVMAEEPTENTNEVEENQEPSQEAAEVEQPKIRVKYNHEERELTLEEATQLAQKGMNYDKLQEKINSIQNDPGMQYLTELANRNGTSVPELVEYWRQQDEQQQLDELVQRNIPEEYAREILENKKFRQQLEAEKRQQTEKQQRDNEYMDFLQTYTDVEPEKIPQEVWDKHKEGVPLKYAYMEHERKQLQDQIKVLKQNEKNSKRAVIGSVTSNGTADNVSEDDFLMGFNSI